MNDVLDHTNVGKVILSIISYFSIVFIEALYKTDGCQLKMHVTSLTSTTFTFFLKEYMVAL